MSPAEKESKHGEKNDEDVRSELGSRLKYPIPEAILKLTVIKSDWDHWHPNLIGGNLTPLEKPESQISNNK
jgi:hypothetical protein